MLPFLPPSDSNQPRPPRPRDAEDQLDEEEADDQTNDPEDQLEEQEADDDTQDGEGQLDEQEADEEIQDPAGLVTVATFPLLNAAELARLHLAEEGIDSILLDAETVNMDWFLGNALGYIKLQVQRRHAEASLDILGQLQPAQKDRPMEDEENEVTLCLACGQEIPEAESTCPACGWSFADEQEP